MLRTSRQGKVMHYVVGTDGSINALSDEGNELSKAGPHADRIPHIKGLFTDRRTFVASY